MEKKKYRVVSEFVLGVLQEVGSIVELTAEQANSPEFGPKIEPYTEEESDSTPESEKDTEDLSPESEDDLDRDSSGDGEAELPSEEDGEKKEDGE